MPASSDRWTLLAAGALIALAAFLLPRTPRDTVPAHIERQRADSLFREVLNARSQVDGTKVMAQQAQRQIRRSVSDMGVRLRQVQQTASRSTFENPDSLKAIITTLSAQADTLLVAQAELVAELDSLDRALVAERNAVLVYRQTADSTVAAYRTALDAAQLAANAPRAACTVLGLPCPTRTQMMAVGVILGALAGVAR
jgi:mRNA-degrading endonuclease HigB of HigAB toxin-antitoxin module